MFFFQKSCASLSKNRCSKTQNLLSCQIVLSMPQFCHCARTILIRRDTKSVEEEGSCYRKGFGNVNFKCITRDHVPSKFEPNFWQWNIKKAMLVNARNKKVSEILCPILYRGFRICIMNSKVQIMCRSVLENKPHDDAKLSTF